MFSRCARVLTAGDRSVRIRPTRGWTQSDSSPADAGECPVEAKLREKQAYTIVKSAAIMQWSDGCVEVGYGFDRSIADAGTVSKTDETAQPGPRKT